jgi:hypothetical protein
MEVYGSEGTLVASGEDAPQHTRLSLQGARGSEPLRELEVPPRFTCVGPNMPAGEPYNVGQMYSRFAHAIRTGEAAHPDFDTAVPAPFPRRHQARIRNRPGSERKLKRCSGTVRGELVEP